MREDKGQEKSMIVIGGGIAGLSCGIYSQLNGYKVQIVDLHTKPGGQCTAWKRKGFRFDYCLHWVVGTARGPFFDIWRETGALTKDVEIVDHEVSAKFIDENGETFYLYTDVERWEQYLIALAPDDRIPIRKMCKAMRKTFVLDPFANPPGMRSATEVLSKVKMLPLLSIWMKHSKQATRDYFVKLGFKNEKLLRFFNALYAEEDFSAVVFLMMLAWFGQKNAGYPMGGSEPFTARMAQRFRELGGEFVLGKRAEEILVDHGKAVGVRLESDELLHADYVVSAADGYNTIYGLLGGRFVTPQITDAYDNWKLFSPFVQASFGLNKVYDTDSVTQFFMAKGRRIGVTTLESGYSVMNYSFDKTMAPEGKSVMVMRFDSPWDLWKDMDQESYLEEKKLVEKQCMELLEALFPGISNETEVVDVATPRTGVRYTGVWQGAYEGFLPSSRNLGKSIDMTLPGLENFYMAGQWLYPGGGVPPAGQSGKWVAQKICKRDKRKFRVQ
jgi:phytoene dehydrogenase-like protein